MSEFHHCHNCGIVMVRAEWITGHYCWGCREVLGKNFDDPEELKEYQRGGLAHPHEFIKKK